MNIRVDQIDDHVAVVEFSQPPHNFFNPDMLWDIKEAYRELGNDGHTRAIVLASEGKHFCAGANFRKAPADPAAPPPRELPHLYDIALMLLEQPLPVVAALQGAVVGGGLGLALSADFRIATAGARLTANFARLGFHHGFGISATLPRVVGAQKAQELLYTGRDVLGDEALGLGLVDKLAEPEALREDAIAMASELALSAPLALRAIRKTMRMGLVEEVREAVKVELREQNILRETEDFKLGVNAKRGEVPQFGGR
ncbi:enoyl-CoA hydratase/isomerase family protein [Sphingobium sp. V4]|uniref:enoyl-CoA hydratase/isomerase family protein n=1 Tax=Sphingobium sp. V4 TaxID=3038927 RepID=UPI00255834CF|nr:enoyl-CoA hydratase/isomerase family protein [Sphingobium sp. V4]WIW89456.1 enoyl-CoA hydratase/isomerase family protein [Sphingobium sp. V4]